MKLAAHKKQFISQRIPMENGDSIVLIDTSPNPSQDFLKFSAEEILLNVYRIRENDEIVWQVSIKGEEPFDGDTFVGMRIEQRKDYPWLFSPSDGIEPWLRLDQFSTYVFEADMNTGVSRRAGWTK